MKCLAKEENSAFVIQEVMFKFFKGLSIPEARAVRTKPLGEALVWSPDRKRS